jgi:hypothetical protein
LPAGITAAVPIEAFQRYVAGCGHCRIGDIRNVILVCQPDVAPELHAVASSNAGWRLVAPINPVNNMLE